MEEKQENNAVNISQESNNAPDTNSEPAPVLSIEERESKLAEREKALEIAERKFFAKDLLSSKSLPSELIDFLDYSSDETTKTSIEKLACILEKYGSGASGIRINTGIDHGRAWVNSENSFTIGLRERR